MKLAITLSIAGSVFAATPLFAHATLDRTEAPADSFYKAVFGIAHGWMDSPRFASSAYSRRGRFCETSTEGRVGAYDPAREAPAADKRQPWRGHQRNCD